MAKDYQKGAKYNVNLNTGSYGSPTWAVIKAVASIKLASNPDDVEVPERGSDMGHLQGENDPEFGFTLLEDKGDANVETLIAALFSGDMKELSISRGLMAGSTVKYWRQESCLMGVDLSAERADPSSYEVVGKRHANSDYSMTRATTGA